jgi:hypothetical protein
MSDQDYQIVSDFIRKRYFEINGSEKDFKLPYDHYDFSEIDEEFI